MPVLRRLHVSVLLAALVFTLGIGALTAFRANALPPVIDLGVTTADITVQGASGNDISGFATAAGDLNGDTVDDLIIGAWVAGSHAGKTYVVYGGAGLPATIDLSSSSADLTVNGKPGSYSSYSVASGDINGDSIDDLIIGAYRAALDHGEAYVIYGGPALPTSIDLSLAPGADITVRGGGSIADSIAQTVAAGDVNGDTYDDLIIGDRNADPPTGTNTGAAYVIYGGPALPSLIELASTSPDVTILGAQPSDLFGQTVAAGDVDGDTVDDLLIGARNVDGPSFSNVGAAYAILGGALPATIDLSSNAADMTVFGVHPNSEFASALATGDVNGDTTLDVIIGAPRTAPGGTANAGEVYVIFGGALPASLDLNSAAPDVRVSGADAWDLTGSAVAAGDISGDGVDDLAFGAEWDDPPVAGQGGQTHVIFGSGALSGTIDLETDAPDLSVLGADVDDKSGSSVSMGDIDGDTVPDLIIGAHLADAPGGNEAGETYVLLAQPPPPVGGVSVDATTRSGPARQGWLTLTIALGLGLGVAGWFGLRRLAPRTSR